MSHARARRAIEVKLDAWADAKGIMIAHGAEAFDPPEGQVYLRAFLLPASTTQTPLSALMRNKLEPGRYYLWRVTAHDQGGALIGKSQEWRVRYQP